MTGPVDAMASEQADPEASKMDFSNKDHFDGFLEERNSHVQSGEKGCEETQQSCQHPGPDDSHYALAIVGIGCRMPGGTDTPSKFWDVIREGRNVITEVPPERWSLEAYHSTDPHQSGTHVTRKAGFVDDIDMFDHTFFKISPREAAMMDPQQRHLLEVTYEAFEDAGITPESVSESCGVFVGIGMMDYALFMAGDKHLFNSYVNTGIAHSVAANRISYAFNLKGPSLAVDTACAASMTAIHIACSSLRNKECSVALVGGSNVLLMPEVTVAFSAMGVLSPDGFSCPFDASANGYVRSEGFGAVLVKPLSDAIRDGDHVYSIIKGSAISDNGFSHSITMPSSSAQEQLMRTTYARFGVPLSDVLYVEAHGTSTPVGDPAEAEAIGNTFGPHRASPLRIGSAKSNFGHMECAAGMVGVIKTALMLDKRTLCPSVNYNSPTPKVDFEELGISVQTKVENFPDNKNVTLGVNCFGFGGALAHVIMEEHNATPPVAPTHHRRGWQFGPSDQEGEFVILPLSGKSSDALRDLSAKWLTFQDEKDALSVSSWVATRRNHYQNRLAVVTNSGAKAREGLQCFANKMATDDVITGTSQNARPKVCFVFPGQGQQWDDMGRKLYQLEPVFRETVDACDQIFTQVSGWSLMQKAGLFTTSDGSAAPAEFTLAEMKVSQPAILFTQVGLFALLKHWCISPDVIVGHSLGEVAAAYACGGLTLDEAIRAIYIRSTEQAKLQGCGSMAAMRASRIEAEELVAKSQGVKLACDNSPTSVTVAGTTEAIAALQDQNPTKVKMLRVSCAFHTDHMDPIRESFLEAMSSVQPDRHGEAPAPLYSTVTGQHYTGRFDGQYWWKNIRGEVKFTSAIRSIIQDHNPDVFIELGASATLLSSVSQTLKHENCPMKVTVPCGQRQQNDHKCMLRALATLYVNGMDINWTNVTQDAAEWTPAPTYAWQHQRHWQEAESSRKRRLGLEDRTFKGQNGHITLEKFPFLADHVVNDSVVFPGAGYIEYMVQMAVDSSDNPTLQDIQFKNVLVWPDVSDLNKSNATIHLTYTKEGRKLEVATDRVHAGCLLTQPSNVSSESIMETTPTEAMEKVTGQNFYERFSDLGLMYGPEFQVVNEAFVGDWKAIGFLKPATDAQQRVQTTTLDGCFQVALAAIGPCSTLYLPTQITTFSMLVPSLPLGEHVVAHATVVSRSSMSVKANIILATVQGNILAQIDGFEATNVSGINSDVDTDSCLYETRWQPVISPLPETSIFCDLFKEEHLQKQYSDEMEMIEAAEKALPNLKRLALSYVQLALDTVPEAEVSPRNKRYIERLRTIIDDVDKTAFDTMSLDEIHKSLDEMRKDVPAMRLEFSMLQRLGDILPTILRDPSAALPILFAADCLADYFMDSLTTRLYYRACTDAIEQAVKTSLEQKQTVRILEVGGRMGGLARYLLKPLKDQGDAGHIEYVFTDLNTTFFAHASQVLEDYAFVKYQQLDIEKAVEPQDFIPGTFDIVVCMDTLHSAVDVMEGLKYMQSLLCPGGWLVMFEATNAFYMCEVVFGSLELCWVYDDDYRTDTCWLSREGWRSLFEDGGMHDVVSVSSPQEFFHSITIGRKNTPLQQAAPAILQTDDSQQWLLVGPTDSPLINAVQRLVPENTMVRSIGDRIDIPSHGLPLRVVYVWPEDDKSLVHARSLTNTLYQASERVRDMWVFTVSGSVECDCPTASAATGFFRVVNNEIRDLQIYTVDLPSDILNGLTDVVETLLKSDPPTERELSIRNGEILTPRLVKTSISDGISTSPSESWALDIAPGKTGTLDDMAFYGQASTSLSDNEVKVKVHAAGLNFKDVMMALGLLEGLKLQTQFGLECSGTVVEVGNDVKRIKVGDEVIAFGDHCFASHVTCDEHFVMAKPSHISWADAAGFSMVYITAYYALIERARLQEGQTLLIHSACGGVGQAAIQVAGMVGARVFCTAGSEEKRNYLRQMGMTHVSDSRSTQFYHDVMKWTDGEGVDVVLSSLYGDLQTAAMKSLKAGGTFCEIGKRSILEGVGMDMGPLLNNKTFLSVQLDLLMKERPKYVRKMMETICSLLKKRHIAPVLTTVKTIDDYKETFRWMSKGQHVGKVVFKMPVKFEPESLVPSSHILEANGTYLITGGFGGVGQSLARWLVDHGAKHIALLSRNGCKTAENVHTVEYMESKGGKVYTYEADVSNKTSLTNVLNHLRADPSVPALKGIFHLAAVIDDANVLDVKDSQLEKSLAAKAWGALHLHELTQDDDLDIFFLLSSVTAAWGNPEQCGYVAANSILDALAEHRHRRGLPALSLQLGAVRGVGILEGNTKAAKIVTGKGMLTLHIDECLQMLPRLLRARDTPVVTLANMDWAKCMQFSYTTSMKFRHLAAGKNKEKSVDADLNEDDLREQVLEQLGQILCMPPSQIDPDQPMINYGVDSLMAVDIVNWMNKNFDLSVSQLDILGGMTTTTLVGKAVVGEVALPLRK
ncbi:highly reducing polyketide synthase 40-like [Branchiostoma floridae]|uniref:Highly reducing polyketide synthase 40-like n=1 Tax=Branchiostoma floridae TaxID=7739 RepID=A0A9J7MIW9_BRAFL|nr:highly reducing polyketide synthase 40-like [Branchiostoma floridae]